MKQLIVCYSRTGTNTILCQELQKKLNCMMEKIIDKKNRSGLINFMRSGFDAVRKNETEIEAVKTEPADHDIVIIGTPLWVGSLPPAIRTYIKRFKDKFKNYALISVCGIGIGNKNALADLGATAGKKPIANLLISEKEFKKGLYKDKLEGFIEKVK
jgi:flavodoxin